MTIEAMKAIQMVYANTTKHDWPDDIWDAICKAIEAEKQQLTNVVNPSIHACSGEKTGEKHQFHHSGIEQKPLALMVVNGEISYKSIDDDQSFGMWCPVNYDSRHSFPDGTKFYTHPQPNVTTSDMKQEHVDKTAKQRHEENT